MGSTTGSGYDGFAESAVPALTGERSGMSDTSADESADRHEVGVGDRRVWATPTVTEHRGLAVGNGVVDMEYREGEFYNTGT